MNTFDGGQAGGSEAQPVDELAAQGLASSRARAEEFARRYHDWNSAAKGTGSPDIISIYVRRAELARVELRSVLSDPVEHLVRHRFHELSETTYEILATEAADHVVNKLHLYDPARPFWPWVKTVVINYTITRIKKAPPIVKSLDHPGGEIETPSDYISGVVGDTDGEDAFADRSTPRTIARLLEQYWWRSMFRDFVPAYLSSCRPAHRQLYRNRFQWLILHIMRNIPQKDIARRYNVTPFAVSRGINQCIIAFRMWLIENHPDDAAERGLVDQH